jgi:hypothetical protein
MRYSFLYMYALVFSCFDALLFLFCTFQEHHSFSPLPFFSLCLSSCLWMCGEFISLIEVYDTYSLGVLHIHLYR